MEDIDASEPAVKLPALKTKPKCNEVFP